MNFIDTHSHIYLEEFDNDRSEVTARAKATGVSRILLPNIDSKTVDALKKTVSEENEYFIPMMGLHPTSVDDNYRDELSLVEKELESGNYIAIGEIGIDLYWDKTFGKQQEEVLRAQFDLALKYDLPVAIHMRNSFDEIIKVCDDYASSGLRGVFHCFTGNNEQARRIIELGYYLGIGGVVTFKNSGLDKAIENIDLQHIILETDAPYLAPVPYRDKRNESSYLTLIAEKLAAVFNTTVEDIASKTTANAINLFKLEL